MLVSRAGASGNHLSQPSFHTLIYKGIQIAKSYVIDFLIEDRLVIELKSVDKLLPIHSAQLMTYLRLLRVSSGLLMNFNVPALPHGIKRILL